MPSVAGLVATCIRGVHVGQAVQTRSAAIIAMTAPASISAADDDVEHDVHVRPRLPDVAGDGREREEPEQTADEGDVDEHAALRGHRRDRDATDDRRDDAVERDGPVDDRCPAGSPGRSTTPRRRSACRSRSWSRRLMWGPFPGRASAGGGDHRCARSSSGVSAATVRRSRSFDARPELVGVGQSEHVDCATRRDRPSRSGSWCRASASPRSPRWSWSAATRRPGAPGRCPTAATVGRRAHDDLDHLPTRHDQAVQHEDRELGERPGVEAMVHHALAAPGTARSGDDPSATPPTTLREP